MLSVVVNSPQLLCHSIRLPGPAPHSPGALFLHQARNGYKHNPLALRLWSLLVTTAFPETLLFLLSPPNPPITSMVILPFTSEMIAVSLVDHILPVPISPKRYILLFSFLGGCDSALEEGSNLCGPLPSPPGQGELDNVSPDSFPQELIIGNTARL